MQFREAVRRYRDVQGTSSPEVEFSHNWPKHEHLDRDQLQWFLYWRSLWERGYVRKTSLSYMNLHIFELLSLEYRQDPQLAVERLVEFYNDFHDIQPRLDVTVVRWIGDFYLKMGEIDNALYWYTHGTAGDLFEKLSWYRFGHRDIPLSFLQKVAGVPKSQFYREHMPGIEPEIERLMQAAFRKFYEIEGMHPLDKFARYTDEPTIYLFSNTPIHEKYYLDGFRRYEQAGTFVHFVKHALRYAENLLRRVEKKPRLKCDESLALYFQDLESDYPVPEVPEKKKEPREGKASGVATEIVQPTLTVELPEEPVVLDLSRVQALTTETEWLVDMMQEENSAEEPLMREAPVVSAVSTVSVTTPSPALFSDIEAGELEEFLENLNGGEQAFLRHLVESGERERRRLAEWLKLKRMFLDATVMKLNESAMDAGFEPLLEDDEDEVYIAEEHEAALREWASRG
ncbi:TerB N-terminal domain-containing protein [Tumebacillus sp. ITR2]|uniref:TerB N-terminal domain-containing protein n=1 Tax=Tumebacillus amylolyticus TaxID=2801339 RepID=A0ABS1J623_9BACL|nr:TerB N-terminal domain-containing protein [Tumebacillus amylolyticus]MBL0385731.1 TerB N-terminal domain-containing protein [Tumebacillus amylolyticus]